MLFFGPKKKKRKENGSGESGEALKAAEDSRLQAEADYARQLSRLDESDTLRSNLTALSAEQAYENWLMKGIVGKE